MPHFIKSLNQQWQDYLSLGTAWVEDKEEVHKIRLMNLIYVFCIIGFLISFASRIYFGLSFSSAVIPLGTTLVFLLLPLASYFNRPRLGWHLASWGVLAAITYAGFVQPVSFANYLLYGSITYLLLFLFAGEKQVQIFYLGLVSLNVFAFTWAAHQGQPPNARFPLAISFLVVLLALLANFLIVLLASKYRDETVEELAHAIAFKKAALESNKDATMIICSNGMITDWNQQYLELWGMTSDDLKNKSKKELLKTHLAKIENREAIEATLAALRKNPNITTFDKIYHQDGRIIESHTQPQILDGKIVGRVYNYRDVTKQYAEQNRLAESEAKFRSIFEHSPLGILIIQDRNRPFLNVNQRLCEMLGYTEAEMSELQLTDVITEDYYPKYINAYLAELNANKTQFTILNLCKTKAGVHFWARLNVSILKDEAGNILSELAMVEDVTEKILQEEQIQNLLHELKVLNEKLEQKVKLRTVDLRQSNDELRRSNQDLEQFAYIASHDLQEPLRMVGNFVQLLERQYKDQIDEEGKEFIYYIVDGVSRMSKLIQNLLKYSRVGRKESALRYVNLDKLVAAKLFGLQQKIKETGATVKLNQLPAKIYCEPDQIGMVFHNLISNALKFNLGQPIIEVGYEEQEEVCVFYVKDDGIGIDKRFEVKVFEIFKRLHRREEYEGTGIGLALCKKIIERHAGKIWFESKLNEGSIFYFTISKKLQHEEHVSLDSNFVGRG